MGKYRRNWKSCQSKHRYPSYNDAMKMIKKRQREGAGYLRAYWCKLCGGWHITFREDEDDN